MVCLSHEVGLLPSLTDPSPLVVTGSTLCRKNCFANALSPRLPRARTTGSIGKAHLLRQCHLDAILSPTP